jgi:hypothetical protein
VHGFHGRYYLARGWTSDGHLPEVVRQGLALTGPERAGG